jgi:hypothetical protein
MRRAIFCAGALLCVAACGGSDKGDSPSSVGAPEPATAGSSSTPPANSGTASPSSSQPTAASNPSSSTPASMNTPSGAQNTPSNPSTPQGTSMPQNMPSGQGTPMAQMPTTPAMPTPQGLPPPDGFKPNAMNECGLHTQWKGDEYCILPPPADKGFQLHIGPSNYDNPEALYLLQPGQETVHTYTTQSANDKNIDFYVRQYRMRPGAHHTIVRDTSTGRRLSGSDVNQDHPVGGITAPENAGLGIPLTAHAPISVDHHAINSTDKALLQEVWVNFWYVDPSKVTETTNLLYDPGSVSATVAPHQDIVLGPYDCDINTPGRLISMFGHVHASNVRFSAWRTRAGQKDLIYESHHWEEPLWLEFTSLAKNPTVDTSTLTDGGWTGILDLKQGDTLSWECHEVNQQDTTLRFTNQTFDGTKCMSRMPGIVIDPNLE